MAYLTYFERKVIAYMHVRIGPNRVGPLGLIQPIADGLKLLLKEIIVPSGADKWVYLIAPGLAIAPALAAWAVVPFADGLGVANIDASLLYIMAIASMGVYGIILAGWASNSKYAFLGAMRSAAQMVSYEISMGFALVTVLMVSNSLNLTEIVRAQDHGIFAGMGLTFLSWNWLPLLPMFVSTWSPAWLKPTGPRSTWWKVNPKSWPATWWNTPAWRSPCSSWPNTPT